MKLLTLFFVTYFQAKRVGADKREVCGIFMRMHFLSKFGLEMGSCGRVCGAWSISVVPLGCIFGVPPNRLERNIPAWSFWVTPVGLSLLLVYLSIAKKMEGIISDLKKFFL
jgi:hypothetical protein